MPLQKPSKTSGIAAAVGPRPTPPAEPEGQAPEATPRPATPRRTRNTGASRRPAEPARPEKPTRITLDLNGNLYTVLKNASHDMGVPAAEVLRELIREMGSDVHLKDRVEGGINRRRAERARALAALED